MEEILVEMYLAEVLVRLVENITEAPRGMWVSAGAVGDLHQELHDQIE